MKRHFTSREVSEYLAGRETDLLNRHLRSCTECEEEVQRVRASLADFKDCVRMWSQARVAAEFRLVRRKAGLLERMGAATAALLAIVVAGASVLYWSSPAPRPPVTDSVLLEQVNRAVSQDVPRDMEPLLSLLPGESQ